MSTYIPEHAAYLSPNPDDVEQFDAYVLDAEQTATRITNRLDDGTYADVELQAVADTVVHYASDEGVIPADVRVLNRLILHNPGTGDTAHLLQLEVTLPVNLSGGGLVQVVWAQIGPTELEIDGTLADATAFAAGALGLDL